MKKLMAVVITFLGAVTVYADNPTGAIGPAGCGLGNMLMGKDSQILAATVNGTGVQTFGITSGTSNCDKGNRTAQLDLFIEVNKHTLATDAARGEGETVASLSKLLGCDEAQVGSTLKSNFETVFPSQNLETQEVSASIKKVLRSNKVSCTHLG